MRQRRGPARRSTANLDTWRHDSTAGPQEQQLRSLGRSDGLCNTNETRERGRQQAEGLATHVATGPALLVDTHVVPIPELAATPQDCASPVSAPSPTPGGGSEVRHFHIKHDAVATNARSNARSSSVHDPGSCDSGDSGGVTGGGGGEGAVEGDGGHGSHGGGGSRRALERRRRAARVAMETAAGAARHADEMVRKAWYAVDAAEDGAITSPGRHPLRCDGSRDWRDGGRMERLTDDDGHRVVPNSGARETQRVFFLLNRPPPHEREIPLVAQANQANKQTTRKLSKLPRRG